MRLILNTGETLTAVLSGAVDTVNPTYLVDTGESQAVGSLSGATPVTLASAAGNHTTVQGLSIFNADTAAVTVTIKRVVGSSSYTLTAQTLQVGDTLQLDGLGVRVVDSIGQVKQASTVSVRTATEEFAILPTDWRKTDGVTVCAASAATTNFGVVYGSDGTNFPTLQTIDSKAATTAVVGRLVYRLSPNYVDGAAVTIRLHAGMLTTIADTSCTIDLNVYSNDGDNTGSADLCETAAQSINSLTFGDKDFVITPTGLVAGQLLHVKLTVTVTDGATATAVIGAVGAASVLHSVSR